MVRQRSARVKAAPTYWLTRFIILRLLGLLYFVAFLTLFNQGLPLLGSKGLQPIPHFVSQVGSQFPSPAAAFMALPSLFWLHYSDAFFMALVVIGLLISFAILIGFANVPMLLANWFLYLSFLHVGQEWYHFGWETQLLETGFLAMFLCPLWDARPFPRIPPPTPIIWLFRWLAFRIYLGAGLIKIRGDSCWRELTCLLYHYETQPLPNPLSPWFHFMPALFHKLGVLWNHFVELVVPFGAFGPGLVRTTAGILMISFQVILILSGNLSFLNWLTILPAIACFDDRFLGRMLPKMLVRKAEHAARHAKPTRLGNAAVHTFVVIALLLSVPVVYNLLSPNQRMNSSFNKLHLVNTYGAFGSVGRERLELIFEGTADTQISEQTQWLEYEFHKPGKVDAPLRWVAPYHYRLDWLLWFAAMATPKHYPWTVNMVWKLLRNDPMMLELVTYNPFPKQPPKHVRVSLYRYRFAEPWQDGPVWEREKVGEWLPPLAVDTPRLEEFVQGNGWG